MNKSNCLKFFVVLILINGSAAAQDRSRPLPLTGTVLDPSGASTPNATVTLKQGMRNVGPVVKTNLSGAFRIESVPAGAYLIEVQHEGFKTSVVPVQVSTSPTSPLTITLELADFASDVSVEANGTAQVSSNISENMNAAAVGENLLDKLPVFDQDYLNTMSMFLDAGSIGTNGTQLIVDGMAATSIGVTPSAIQEVRINQNPYSAEYPRPGRGSVEIITKASTPEYHGTINFIFRDSALNARDPFSLVRAAEQRRIFEGALSGPIGRSKSTSFLLSASRQEEDLQSTIFASLPGGLFQQTLPSPRRNTQIAFRLSHQFSQNHTSFWNYNDWVYPSSNQGVGGLVLAEAATNVKNWEREFIYNDRQSLSPHWLNQFQILVGYEYHSTTSVNSGQKIVVNDSFTSGGGQVYKSETEVHFQLNEIVSWASGKHLVKFGLNVPEWGRRGINNQNNFGGTFFFSSLEEYAVQRPYAYRQQQGSGHIILQQRELGSFVQDEISLRPNFSLALGMRYNWQNFIHDFKDFAPRIAFAYAPGKISKLVIRGGAGIFFDRTGPAPLADSLLYDGRVLRGVLLTDPPYPAPIPAVGSLNDLPSEVLRFDPAVSEPYTIQYSVGVERQLARRTTLAVTYIGSRGIGLFRSRDINAPLAPSYAFRPDPTKVTYRQIESSGRQASDSVEVTLRGDLARFFTGMIQYTLNRTNNNTGGINWYPASQFDLSEEWGRADFDQRHRLTMLESFSLGKLFTLGMSVNIASGKPYSMTTGEDPFHTGFANARPSEVSRNTLTSPGFEDLSLRLARDFTWKSATKDKAWVFTAALDAFNVLNHADYPTLVGNLSSPFFGQAISALPPRRLQLTFRAKF